VEINLTKARRSSGSHEGKESLAGILVQAMCAGILVQAMCATKNIRAQRERLLQFQLQLQPNRQGDNPPDEVVSGLIRLKCEGLEASARYLNSCLAMTAQCDVPLSLPVDFGLISDEQLFGHLLAQRLPRCPVTQAQAFTHLEAAFYAVGLNLKYSLTRCIGHLGYPKCVDVDEVDDESFHGSIPNTDDEHVQDDGLEGTVNDVAEHLAKTSLSAPEAAATGTESLHYGGSEVGLPDPVSAATEDLGLSAPDAAATDEPPQDDSDTDETSQAASIDMERACTYLDGACALADFALKHVDIAVTAISSCLDPAEVASMSAFTDTHAYTK
jgi:hypothetical protein